MAGSILQVYQVLIRIVSAYDYIETGSLISIKKNVQNEKFRNGKMDGKTGKKVIGKGG